MLYIYDIELYECILKEEYESAKSGKVASLILYLLSLRFVIKNVRFLRA